MEGQLAGPQRAHFRFGREAARGLVFLDRAEPAADPPLVGGGERLAGEQQQMSPVEQFPQGVDLVAADGALKVQVDRGAERRKRTPLQCAGHLLVLPRSLSSS